ncbi:unnamed protein product, partial [Ixodes hexagonus]
MQGRAVNFDTVNLKDLRVTKASKRLRTCIISSSIGYIFIFTPMLAYFIWNNLMADPASKEYALRNGSRCARVTPGSRFKIGFQEDLQGNRPAALGPGSSYGETVLAAAHRISSALLNGTAVAA